MVLQCNYGVKLSVWKHLKTCTVAGSSVSLGADSYILVSEQEEKYLHCEHGVRLLYRVFGNLEDSD